MTPSAMRTDMLPTFDEVMPDHVELYTRGSRTFALLFTRWMDSNGWSHPVMTSLARSAMGGIRWLHSSQISGLRHSSLENPGPRTFIVIAELNRQLHRYRQTKRLIPGTESSRHYSDPFVITENGEPPTAGWFFEVFCGLRVPQDIDLNQAYCTDSQAEAVSANWGALVRKLIRNQDLDLITDLDRILREHYPAKDVERLKRIRGVIQNQYVWTPDELLMELPALSALTSALGGPSSEAEIMRMMHGA